ncbi:hypothetical protein A2160_00120, partial [Candidatus Beckwithbacteria bacterium RBG_13_42_9]
RQLKRNQALSPIEVQDLLLLSWQEDLYNQTIRYLSLRPHSQKEIRDYLSRRIFVIKRKSLDAKLAEEMDLEKNLPTLINKIIDRLKGNKFIDDREFSRWLIRQRLTYRPRGKRALLIELRQKGVDKEVTDEVMADESVFSAEAEEKTAQKLAEKIWKNFKLTKGSKPEIIYKYRQRLWQRLISRGFSYNLVKTIVDDLLHKE